MLHNSLVAQLSTEFMISYTFLWQVTKTPSCPERRLAGHINIIQHKREKLPITIEMYSELSIQCSVVLEGNVPLELRTCKNGLIKC